MSISQDTTTLEHHHHPPTSRAGKVKAFVWHLFQMAAAMELGMLLYMLLRRWFAPPDYVAWQAEYPLMEYWIMVVFMTIPMVALMRYHRYAWRDCAGMTAAMIAPLVVLSVPVQLNWWTIRTLHWASDVAMLLG